MTKNKYLRFVKRDNVNPNETFPIKIGKFPNDVVEFERFFIYDTYQIKNDGDLSLVSVFWVKPSSWKEMTSFKGVIKHQSDQLPGYIFYSVEEDIDYDIV